MASESSTAETLIHHAIDMFGGRGLEGVATRQIAAAAGKPMSAITYHFGGKEGLYLACARHIAASFDALLTPVADYPQAKNAAEAREQLSMLTTAVARAVLHRDHACFAQFIMREQQEPTEAFAIVYGGVMGRLAERVIALLQLVGGATLSVADARVRAIAIMGQILAFRVARATVLRLNGWADIGPDEIAAIERALQANLKAILDDLERQGGQ